MDERRKGGIHRRGVLNGLVGGLTVSGLAAAVAAPLGAAAVANTKNEDDKRKSLYRESNEVKTYYRVNRYPA